MNEDYDLFLNNIYRIKAEKNGSFSKEMINVGITEGKFSYIGNEYRDSRIGIDGSGFIIIPGSVDTIFYKKNVSLMDAYVNLNYILRRKLINGTTTVYLKTEDVLLKLIQNSQPVKIRKYSSSGINRVDFFKKDMINKENNLNCEDEQCINLINIGLNADFSLVANISDEFICDLNYSDIISVFIDGKCVYDKN